MCPKLAKCTRLGATILRSFRMLRVQGVGKDTRGTAFVVYEDIYDAKMAVEHLSGFNVANRYLIVLYYNPARQTKKVRFQQRLQSACPL